MCYRVRTQPLQIFQFYHRRFGIESSYRQMNRVRARTSSTDPAPRLLYVGVAFLMRAIERHLHGGHYSHTGNGSASATTGVSYQKSCVK